MWPLPPVFQPPLGPRKLTARERVSAQWRGINVEPLEKAQTLTARATGDVLPLVLKDLRFDRRRAEAEIIKVWSHVLDPDITAHAHPTGLRKGTLFVSVDSSAWLCEIVRNHRREILTRLRHSFGRDLITKISFRVG